MSSPVPHLPPFPWKEITALKRLWREAHEARFEKGHSEPSQEERAFKAMYREAITKYRLTTAEHWRSVEVIQAQNAEKDRVEREISCARDALLREESAKNTPSENELLESWTAVEEKVLGMGAQRSKAEAQFMSTLAGADGPIWR
jgi:hypothetical protein